MALSHRISFISPMSYLNSLFESTRSKQANKNHIFRIIRAKKKYIEWNGMASWRGSSECEAGKGIERAK